MANRLKGQPILARSIQDMKNLIGKEVIYLRRADIDYSGRGYFFPRIGKITDARYRTVTMNQYDYYQLDSFVEMVEATQENIDANFKKVD